ncbi:unnamed protein product [Oppiella nova]|uniref:Uncharacterized protein n=1 Tax=Oppiella nova TaxID=334625 RepID=A0A7R9LTH6_9ACAR|nr:unnamed protein product [Oppiella nova]CAG2166827.1 unnamed protein product [Oppiella nova]
MAYIKRDPFPISDLIKSNKDKIQTNLDDFSNAKVESKFHQLKHELNINDEYSINLNEFKGKVFPRLWELLSTTSALMLLQLILYNDYKTQRSQLIKSALKASLVPQLVNIYETTRDIQTKQLVINLFSVFCLSFESNPKLRKHVLNNNVVIDSILSDESLKVKRCAVNAMFVTAYNADVKDQLTPLAKGCLPVLCSQLDSDDKEYLNLVLLTIISFLFWEFKAFLGKEKKLLTSEDTLSPFAVIIQDCDGLQRLNQINSHRRDKESNNKYYKPTQEERRVEEIMALAFHMETRPLERKQSVYVLYTFPGVNIKVKQQQCLGCKKEMDPQKKFVRADTTIFSCKHLNLCKGCAVKGVTKMYNQESDLPTLLLVM